MIKKFSPFTACFFTFATLIVPPAHAAGWPTDFTAQYTIDAGFVSAGKASKQLRKLDNGHYEYHSKSSTTGMMAFLVKDKTDERSELVLHQNQPRPIKHVHVREGRKAKTATQKYNWKINEVESSVKGTIHRFTLPADAIDQGAYQLALMMRLANGERNFTLNVAEHKRMEQYPIRHIDSKKLKTALGKFETIVIHSKYKKQSTTLWCAPELDYLPVRIEHREGGVTYTANLVQLQKR